MGNQFQHAAMCRRGPMSAPSAATSSRSSRPSICLRARNARMAPGTPRPEATASMTLIPVVDLVVQAPNARGGQSEDSGCP